MVDPIRGCGSSQSVGVSDTDPVRGCGSNKPVYVSDTVKESSPMGSLVTREALVFQEIQAMEEGLPMLRGILS